MRRLSSSIFSAAVCVALIAACEPDLDPLSAEFGRGGRNQGGTVSEMGGFGGTSGSGGRAPNSGGTTTEGGAAPQGGETTAPDTCTDSKRNFGESDVDCGGTSLCERCDLNGRCSRHADCLTELCFRGLCSEPSCEDEIQNQNETGVDCGGACAPELLCELGAGCKVHGDCETDYCADGTCEDHCSSRRRDGDETDIDCGGATCPACPNDKACLVLRDCESGVCKNNNCVAPSCDDDVKNQDESDTDCGGVCRDTRPCAPLDTCNEAADCASYICTSDKCVADIVIPALDVIDDLEDGNMVLPKTSGRAGNWFTFADASEGAMRVLTPGTIAGGRAGSKIALNFTTTGYKVWGSGFGFDFNNTGSGESTKKPWDASGYSGITFWAKAAKDTALNVQLPDRQTHKSGGICTVCDFNWAKFVQVKTEWARYTVFFSEMSLTPGGDPAPTELDKTGIVMMQFFFPPGAVADIWVDDIALVK